MWRSNLQPSILEKRRKMKKVIIISLIAVLGYSFTATFAMADCASRYGWRGSIAVGGCGPAAYASHFSIFLPPLPFILPPPPPFFIGTGCIRRGACYDGHHRGHHDYHHRHWKDRKYYGEKHRKHHHGNGKAHRSYRHQRHF